MTQIKREISEEEIFVPNAKKKIQSELASFEDADYVFCPAPRGDEVKNEVGILIQHERGAGGIHVSPEERMWASAKMLRSQRGTKYFIKTSSRGELFDFTNSDHSDSSGKITNGIPKWSMKEVKKDQFDNYIQFLRTSNKTFYNQARQVF